MRLPRSWGDGDIFLLSESQSLLRAWIDPAVKRPKTIHHRGRGRLMVAGKTITLDSNAK